MKVRVTKLDVAETPRYDTAKSEDDWRKSEDLSPPQGHIVVGDMPFPPEINKSLQVFHMLGDTYKLFSTSPLQKIFSRENDFLMREWRVDTMNSRYMIEEI